MAAVFDFSALKRSSGSVARALGRGDKITDEDWLEAVGQFEPPLLPPKELKALVRILDPGIERRGRPARGALNAQAIVDALGQVTREDLPSLFKEGLIARLRSRRRYTRHDLSVAVHKGRKRSDRDLLITGLYDFIYEVLAESPALTKHAALRSLDVPKSGARSQRALALTGRMLSTYLGHVPPSSAAMMNMITRSRFRKRRPRT